MNDTEKEQLQNASAVTAMPAMHGNAVRDSLKAHRLIIVLVIGYWVAAWATSHVYDLPHDLAPSLAHYAALFFTPIVFALCWHAITVMVYERPRHLIRHLIISVSQQLTRRRLVFAAPVLLLLPVFAATFTYFKMAIPLIEPYSWDGRLSEWDRLLHGGEYPWVWLQPVLGYPLVTGIINFLYSLWFFIMYAMLALQAFALQRPRLRMQFLLSFVLSWMLLGTLGAIALASMGPCYYPTFAQESGPYAPLMSYLRETGQTVPVWALNVQQMLWDNYQNTQGGIGSGISAMPSMHVATAVLLALFGWRHSRKAGVALTLYALAIMIGSVHLGWHYALDGYVGALGAALIWFLAGRLVNLMHVPRAS